MRLNRWNRTREGSLHSEEKWETCSPWADDWVVKMSDATSTPMTADETASDKTDDEHCENVAPEDEEGSNPKDWKDWIIGSVVIPNTHEAEIRKKGSRQSKLMEKLGLTPGLTVFTCGCGDFSAENLCTLLYQVGIRSVLDVRALSKSKKKPWFNSDRLVKVMGATALDYKFIGKGRKSHTVVAAHVERCEQPVCLLGFRASPLECLRLVLSEKLQKGLGWNLIHLEPSGIMSQLTLLSHLHQDIFERYSSTLEETAAMTSRLERAFGFTGHWRARVLAQYRSVSPILLHKDTYDQWDRKISTVDQTVIELPWGSVLVVLPRFSSGSELQSLQQNSLPGAINYEQPRRHVRSADGSFISFTDHWKEAWLCNDYGYQDPSRVSPPHLYRRQPLAPWAKCFLERASCAAMFPFNGLMCRWDPPGTHSDEGSRSFARGSPIPEYAVVGMIALNGSRNLRVHGLGCWERLVVDIPMQDGTLVVFGGPLKERWLYSHVRDKEVRGESVFLNLLLHVDSLASVTADRDGKQVGLEGTSSTASLMVKSSGAPASSPSLLPEKSSGNATRARWRRGENIS